jgi:hypothetical protein
MIPTQCFPHRADEAVDVTPPERLVAALDDLDVLRFGHAPLLRKAAIIAPLRRVLNAAVYLVGGFWVSNRPDRGVFGTPNTAAWR